jgi:S1-C subfamily serine protease
MGQEIKLTTGIISSNSGSLGDTALFQISAPIQPGNSGGPLFDNYGNLIGVIGAKHKNADNVGYVIKFIY